ncbi:hypothetical protein AURDEDRAFT_112301 [Auricularia subglabra TFB-10046 SS5]|nr:hypothetical protein AURDEDRAFT_112301 [Auricularia subglabra TFB-10046 SS5]
MPAFANAPMLAMPAYASAYAPSGSSSPIEDSPGTPSSPFWSPSAPEWMLDNLDGAKPLRGTASYQSLTAAARAVASTHVPAAAPRRRQQPCKLAKLVLPRLSRPSTSDSEYSDAPHTPVSPWDDGAVLVAAHDDRAFSTFASARAAALYRPAPPVGLGFSPIEVSSPLSLVEEPSACSPAEIPGPVELVSCPPPRHLSSRLRSTCTKVVLKLLKMALSKLSLSLLFKLMMRAGPIGPCIPALYVLVRVCAASRQKSREELCASLALVL